MAVVANRAIVFGYAARPAQPLSLGQLASSELRADEIALGRSSGTTVATTLAGVNARFISISGRLNGVRAIVYEVVAVRDGVAYAVGWIGRAGHEATDLATFRSVLATFAFS